MNQQTQTNQNTTKYLAYAAITLLIINFILIFVPFMEIFAPTESGNLLGFQIHKGWKKEFISSAMFVFPVFLTGIPYLCSIISLGLSYSKKDNKNSFFKIKNEAVDKPIRFFWLKFASVANLIVLFVLYYAAQSMVSDKEQYGAYCDFTFFGIMNIICTISFIVLLFFLSFKTKNMFTLINKETLAAEKQFTKENDTEDSAQ